MGNNEKELQQYAQHCRLMAKGALSATDRAHWHSLADHWLRAISLLPKSPARDETH